MTLKKNLLQTLFGILALKLWFNVTRLDCKPASLSIWSDPTRGALKVAQLRQAGLFARMNYFKF